ncbi:COG2426 family protein [Clostridium polynesiense]|uniref:COG2426 family protein n=1 Tax=Clostridium polynesiense TaxID=1325933 RepID=UPI00058D2882|nr:small multi-drug export protein [Clostridium polynesiense]
MSKLLFIFLFSAVPIVEQRGAIPIGILAYNYNPLLVMVLSYIGSLLPVPFIMLLFNKIYNWLKTKRQFDFLTNIIDNKIRKNIGKFEKYKEIALITFIAIPLPTTGVWTGTAIAAFLGLDFKKSFLCAALGGLLSAIIITVISVMIPGFFPVKQVF